MREAPGRENPEIRKIRIESKKLFQNDETRYRTMLR